MALSEDHLIVIEIDAEHRFTFDTEPGNEDLFVGRKEYFKQKPWPKWISEDTVRGSIMDILTWAQKHGCPWDSQFYEIAAYKGYLSVIQWAYSQGHPLHPMVYACAAGGGQLPTLKWLMEDCPSPLPLNGDMCSAALQSGQLNILYYLYNKRAPYGLGQSVHCLCTDFLEKYKKDWFLRTFELPSPTINEEETTQRNLWQH
jgi:hypothetical protein